MAINNERRKTGLNYLILLLLLSLLLGLRGRLLRRGRVLSSALLINLLEEAEGSVLGLADLLADAIGSDGGVADLTFSSEFTEFTNELRDLILLGGIELIFELIHG